MVLEPAMFLLTVDLSYGSHVAAPLYDALKFGGWSTKCGNSLSACGHRSMPTHATMAYGMA